MKKIINNIRLNVNNIRTIVIILIGVTILFTLLGVFNLSPKENMEDKSQCYPDYVVDNDNLNDKYILKTKIVPPKGTACPTEISDSASKYLDDIDKTDENGQNNQNNQSIESISSNSTNSTSNYTSITESQAASPAPAPVDSTPSPANNNLMDQYAPINQTTQPLTQNHSVTNDKNTCPPCPACERCPEPAFDCKKVPNYRSPSMGQYLPLPILNDFSTF
jgi:hypothetical protein